MASTSTSDVNSMVDDRIYYTDVNGYRVPQNVRHRFRSTVTDELLADKTQVERDKNQIHYVDIKYVPSSSSRRPKTAGPTTDPHSDYAQLSNDLRASICHGFPVLRGSHSKIVHNAHLFTEHFQTLALEKKKLHRLPSYGRKKDWLGQWTEANIIRDRLMKTFVEAQKKTTTGTGLT